MIRLPEGSPNRSIPGFPRLDPGSPLLSRSLILLQGPTGRMGPTPEGPRTPVFP